jgi:hypothetical protein
VFENTVLEMMNLSISLYVIRYQYVRQSIRLIISEHMRVYPKVSGLSS